MISLHLHDPSAACSPADNYSVSVSLALSVLLNEPPCSTADETLYALRAFVRGRREERQRPCELASPHQPLSDGPPPTPTRVVSLTPVSCSGQSVDAMLAAARPVDSVASPT